MIIAGDIGGTKTNLALFERQGESYNPLHLKSYPSQKFNALAPIVQAFIEEINPKEKIVGACFAIAGPVFDSVAKTTNLPWLVDAKKLAKTLDIPNLFLINDLEANAYAIEILPTEGLHPLCPGEEKGGNRGVVSPGTGLGEAGLFFDGKRHHPFACEGGHVEFGPRNEVQIDLCRYLYRKFGHASYERILSGPGLHNVYLFFKEELKREEPKWLQEAMTQKDPSYVISENALSEKSELCVDALDLFVAILGAEASNLALKLMATGGIYLGGGIPPKILPKLESPTFHTAFLDKGRFQPLLEKIPIWVILDDKASLKGAAHFCRQEASLFL